MIYYRDKKLLKSIDRLPILFEEFLGESSTQSKRLAKEWLKFRIKSNKFWEDEKSSSFSACMASSKNIHLADKGAIKAFLEHISSGVILLTIHMGDYLHAVFKILSLTSGRDILLLRNKDPLSDELHMFKKLEKLGHKISVIYRDPTLIRKALSRLRKGAILVALHDLSQEWGRTVVVNAFERKLHWTSGPIELAILGKSCVFPFYCFQDNGIYRCRLEPIRDYRTIAITSRRQFITMEVQHFVSQAERYIRRYPAQWSHWPLVPSMLHK